MIFGSGRARTGEPVARSLSGVIDLRGIWVDDFNYHVTVSLKLGLIRRGGNDLVTHDPFTR